MPKQWVGNVCASIMKNIFTDWVKAQVERRNRELVVDRGLNIQMDPKIAAIFASSTKISGRYRHFFDFLTTSFTFSTARVRSPHAQGRLQAQTHQGVDRRC